jgi:hypothetical protein
VAELGQNLPKKTAPRPKENLAGPKNSRHHHCRNATLAQFPQKVVPKFILHEEGQRGPHRRYKALSILGRVEG